MEVTIDKDKKHTVILDGQHISKLWKYLDERFGNVKATAECSDGSTMHYAALSELLEIENSRSRRVKRLRIACGDLYKEGALVSVRFGVWTRGTATFSITSGDESKALHTATEVERLLRDSIPSWHYDLISRASFLVTLSVCCFIYTVGSSFARVNGQLPKLPDIAAGLLFDTIVIGAAMAMVLLGFAVALDVLKLRLYPRSFLRLGRAERDWDTMDKLRGKIGVGALLIAVTLGLSTKWLGNILLPSH